MAITNYFPASGVVLSGNYGAPTGSGVFAGSTAGLSNPFNVTSPFANALPQTPPPATPPPTNTGTGKDKKSGGGNTGGTTNTGGTKTTTTKTATTNVSNVPTFYSGNMPTGPSPEEMAQIESNYNEGMNYLSGVENRLRPEFQSALEEAQSIYNTQASVLGGQKQTATGQLQEQGIKGQQAYESALAQARQMYDQLQRGYQQRFGGASSAGQAATEIASQERLRQQGLNYRTLQDVNRQVQSGLQNIEQQYNQGLLQLEQNKISAQNQARREFNDKLNQIDAQRGQLGRDKANQKLQALQTLRQQIMQIDAEARNFQNTFTLNKAQQQQALELYREQLKASAGNTLSTTQSQINALAQTFNNQNLTPEQRATAAQQAGLLIGQASLTQQQRDYYKALFGNAIK